MIRADRIPPTLLVLAAVSSVQFGGAFAKTLFDEVGPAGTAFLRVLFAALILAALWRPAVRGLSRAEWQLALAYGFTLVAMNLTFYEALDRIPLGIAVTFEFVGPLGVAIAGSRRALDLVWVALAAAGILLLSDFGGAELDGLGVALALLAGCFWAAYIGVAVAVLSSVSPYTLELEALRRMPAGVFGVLMSLEPAAAALAGFIVLDEGLVTREVVAIALVVAASAGAARNARVPPRDA